jgi:acetoin utilization deacetylase AcuC-like enzyme
MVNFCKPSVQMFLVNAQKKFVIFHDNRYGSNALKKVMKTLYYHHPDFLNHHPGADHPESPERLHSIEQALKSPVFKDLTRILAPLNKNAPALIRLIHNQAMTDRVLNTKIAIHEQHLLDYDTLLSAGSAQAALRAVSAVCDAVDKVCTGQAKTAFCAMRPPGHHATPQQSMGFCLFNNIAIAAEYARSHYHLTRVAIVDFDVHHGNGTQAAFYNNPQVFYASSHEMPHYPGTGLPQETGIHHNIVNVPLHARETGASVRKKYNAIIFPALRAFKPQLLLISAGFDAHKDDPLGGVMLVEDDYRWLTQELLAVANEYCAGRVISALEGGYDLKALAASVAVHVEALLTT